MDGHNEPKCSMIIIIIAIIGILSCALGFAAEATSPRIYEVRNRISGDCEYPKSPAQKLGIAALVTLLLVRFYCPIDNPSPKARLSLISSWVAWLAAMSFYVIGLVMISNQYQEMRYNGFRTYSVCRIVKPGIFGAGAAFGLASIVLEIIYLIGT